jgi:hypothetical protein
MQTIDMEMNFEKFSISDVRDITRTEFALRRTTKQRESKLLENHINDHRKNTTTKPMRL